MRGPERKRMKIERRLRRQSTDAEMVLWLFLRDRRLCGFKFVRQEAIESFIVDFVCREKKLMRSMVVSTRIVRKIGRVMKRWLGAATA